MSRAWYMDDSMEDQRQEHQQNPPKLIPLEDLKAASGVLSFKVMIIIQSMLLILRGKEIRMMTLLTNARSPLFFFY